MKYQTLYLSRMSPGTILNGILWVNVLLKMSGFQADQLFRYFSGFARISEQVYKTQSFVFS